jgi:putative flippase GtrA
LVSPPPHARWASLWRYGLVGAVSTAAHYALMALCVERGWLPAYLASGVGAVVGAQVAYVGNRWFTFGGDSGIASSWAKFQLTALIGALIGMGIVGALVALGWHYLAAQGLATAMVMVLTFQINRVWSFR